MADYRYDRDDDRGSNRNSNYDRTYGNEGNRGSGRDRNRSSGYRDQHPNSYASERSYGNRDRERDVAIDETGDMIASNKVEGTPVYSRRGGDRLGTIYNFMVDKRSGRVKYAVMSFGGFLGIGQHYHPLPWEMLTYDTREDGYVVDLDERDLEQAPSYRRGEEPWYDRGYGHYVSGYYGFPF